MSNSKSSSPIRFGVFEVDTLARELRKHGRLIPLQEQPIQLLLLLLERPGEVVTRDEARSALWKEDTFVDFDHGLGAALNRLRAALGDSASNPRFIETLPRRGYRFILPIQPAENGREASADGDTGALATGSSGIVRRRVAAGAIVAALLAAVAYLSVRPPSSPEPIPEQDKVMLAVLPLDNLDGDPDREYFSDGLTEEIITRLGQVNPSRLGVIARTSVMPYKGSGKTIDQIGRELGVSYVLEGSVRREGDQVRITAQLIEVDDQTHVWAQTYDRDLEEVIALQTDVSNLISQALAVEVLPAANKVRSRVAVHPAAHEAYLKGLYFRDTMTEEGYTKGIEYFKRAVELDDKYAPAYAGMAGCHCLLSGHGLEVLPPREAMPLAKLAAQRALELDDSLAEAHAVMGMVHMKFDWDFEAAERDFRRAIELNSSYAQAHLWYSFLLHAMGRHEDAISRARKARELSPLSLEANVNLGLQLLNPGRYDEAVQQIEQALELNPDFWGAHWGLGICYRQAGKYTEAVDEFEKAAELSNRNTVSVASLGHAYAVAGQRSEALGIVSELNARKEEMYVSPAFLGFIHAALGEPDDAFQLLDRAYEQRSRYLVWLRVAPEYEPLRSDSRYQDLVDRMRLASAPANSVF